MCIAPLPRAALIKSHLGVQNLLGHHSFYTMKFIEYVAGLVFCPTFLLTTFIKEIFKQNYTYHQKLEAKQKKDEKYFSLKALQCNE